MLSLRALFGGRKTEQSASPQPPAQAKPPASKYEGPERRSGDDRRAKRTGQPSAGLRRSLSGKGRRKNDR